jgi:hypothetical protein
VFALYLAVLCLKSCPQIAVELTDLQNRYLPVFHVAYKGLIMFGYTKTVCLRSLRSGRVMFIRPQIAVRARPWVLSPASILTPSRQHDSCQRTKWEINLYTVIVAFLAQTTIALRSSGISQTERI